MTETRHAGSAITFLGLLFLEAKGAGFGLFNFYFREAAIRIIRLMLGISKQAMTGIRSAWHSG